MLSIRTAADLLFCFRGTEVVRRMLAIGWSVLFFGFFSYMVIEGSLWPKLFG